MTSIAFAIGTWGLITGVAMAKSGLPMWLMLLMSLTVFAGTAQLAVLPVLASGAPLWVVWATAACVNLRFVIFSATWRRYFVVYPWHQRLRLAYFAADLNYVLFVRRFPEPKPAPEQLPYYWGGALTNWFSWQIPSLVGLWLGGAVPVHWGFGFAGSLALVGFVCTLINDRATSVAAVVAGCAAIASAALPLKLNVVVAIAAAVAVGVLIDHHKPAAPHAGDDPT